MSGKGAKGLIMGKLSGSEKETRFGVIASVRQFVVDIDEELDTLIKGTIAGGGVIPRIHKSLINKSAKE